MDWGSVEDGRGTKDVRRSFRCPPVWGNNWTRRGSSSKLYVQGNRGLLQVQSISLICKDGRKFLQVSLWLNSLRKPRPPSVGFEDECLPVRLYGGEYWGHSKELTHKTPYECTRLIVMMSYFEAVFPKYIHYSQLGEKLCYVVLASSSFGIGPEPRPRDQIDSWTSSQAGEIRKRCAYYRVRKCRTHQSGEHEAAPWVPHMFWRNAGTSIQHN